MWLKKNNSHFKEKLIFFSVISSIYLGKLRSLQVSLNSLSPCSLLWSDESGVRGHIIAYLTVKSRCTNSAHGLHDFLAMKIRCDLQTCQDFHSVIQRFSWCEFKWVTEESFFGIGFIVNLCSRLTSCIFFC